MRFVVFDAQTWLDLTRFFFLNLFLFFIYILSLFSLQASIRAMLEKHRCSMSSGVTGRESHAAYPQDKLQKRRRVPPPPPPKKKSITTTTSTTKDTAKRMTPRTWSKSKAIKNVWYCVNVGYVSEEEKKIESQQLYFPQLFSAIIFRNYFPQLFNYFPNYFSTDL